MMPRFILLAVLLLSHVCYFASAQGMQMSDEEEEVLEQMGIKGQPMGRKNQKPQAELLKSDFKYIRCGVCRKMVEEAYFKAQDLLEKRFQLEKKKKRKNDIVESDGEGAVQEYLEKMCNPLKPEGEWVGMIDLKQEGDVLQLAQQPSHGKCQKECRTIEAVCEETLDKADTEFTEILYKAIKEGTSIEQVQRYICNRAAGVCKKKPPPVKNRKVDERFQPMTPEEKQMQDMQVSPSRSPAPAVRAAACIAPRACASPCHAVNVTTGVGLHHPTRVCWSCCANGVLFFVDADLRAFAVCAGESQGERHERHDVQA
jgi:hypothetical protein